MNRFALLSLTGRDRPGIVSCTARVLFEAGCNIEDSSMTRLRGQFTCMLALKLPEGLEASSLADRFNELSTEMDLAIHVRALPEDARPDPESEDRGCFIHVLGADKPGIVYRTARILEQLSVNVIDLQTQVIGSKSRPIYAMSIEAELAAEGDLEPLGKQLSKLAHELGVEITVRPNEQFTL
ncbi:MAG: amino acid-binding protein [Magnetococcales bacterium]|nr:amino acid-binding protein [Magnetococcales bacterium]